MHTRSNTHKPTMLTYLAASGLYTGYKRLARVKQRDQEHVFVCLHGPACRLCQTSKQLALLGPMRPQPTKIWKRKFVKLMVVGDSGLGKTTLISALLSKPGEQLQVSPAGWGGGGMLNTLGTQHTLQGSAARLPTC